MKRIIVVVFALALLLVAIPLTGCGISQTDYDSLVADLASLTSQHSQTKADLSQAQTDLEQAQFDVAWLQPIAISGTRGSVAPPVVSRMDVIGDFRYIEQEQNGGWGAGNFLANDPTIEFSGPIVGTDQGYNKVQIDLVNGFVTMSYVGLFTGSIDGIEGTAICTFDGVGVGGDWTGTRLFWGIGGDLVGLYAELNISGANYPPWTASEYTGWYIINED